MNIEECRKRFEALWSERKTVEEQWQTIEQYVAPYKGKFFKSNPGEGGIEWRETRRNYDSTAVQAHIQLASSIHGALTNPAIQWFDMQWRDEELRKNHNAQVWIEKAAKKVFDTLQDSNFNLEANNAYRSLTRFATAALMEEPIADFTDPWAGVNFTSVPIKQVYFEPDEHGQCLHFYRLMSWRPSRIVAKFGYDMVPERVQTAYDAGADTNMDVVFCCYTRQDKQGQEDAILPPENRPFGWRYFMRDNGEELLTGGYYEMPATIPRWEITDESMWGNGPAHYVLGDILTLNQLVELDIKSREKVVDPALLVQERALLNNLDLSSGAQNVMRDIDGVRPFESAARFDAVESSIVRLRMSVEKAFYIDQLELKDSPAMTATEVSARMELMQRMLASPMARLREDMIDPVLQRTFRMLLRAGQLGEVPEAARGAEFDVQYIGPLSRSMKFDQSASIERWITQLQLIAQAGGEAEQVLLVPDYDEIAREAARNLNLPTRLTKSKAQVEEEMENRREAAVRQASAEAAAAEAAAAKDLGQAEQLRAGEQGLVGIG